MSGPVWADQACAAAQLAHTHLRSDEALSPTFRKTYDENGIPFEQVIRVDVIQRRERPHAPAFDADFAMVVRLLVNKNEAFAMAGRLRRGMEEAVRQLASYGQAGTAVNEARRVLQSVLGDPLNNPEKF